MTKYRVIYTEEGPNLHRFPFWKDFGSSSTTFDNVLTEYLNQEHWIYDSDGYGERDFFVGISLEDETHYYKIHHEWSWDYTNDNEDDTYLLNSFAIEELREKPETLPGDRDWINTKGIQWPDPQNWPPRNSNIEEYKQHKEPISKEGWKL